jgi:O-antigen/teichoic acid export membrane protein
VLTRRSPKAAYSAIDSRRRRRMHWAIFRPMFSYLRYSTVASAIGMVTSYVAAWLMLPAELGRFGVLLSIFFLVGPLVSMSAESLILIKKTEMLASQYIEYRRRLVSLLLFSMLTLTIILLAAYVIKVVSLIWYAALPLLAALRTLSSLTSMEFVVEGESRKYGVFLILTASITLAMTFACLLMIGRTAQVRVATLIACEVMVLSLRYRGSYRLLVPGIPRLDELREIVAFGAPLVLSTIPAWFFNEGDKFFIAEKLGLPSAGGYLAACTVAGAMVLFNQALVNSLTPRIYQLLSSVTAAEEAEPVRKELQHVLLVGSAILLGLGALLSLGALLVGGQLLPQRYAVAVPLMPYALFALVFNGIYRIIAIPIEFFRLTKTKTLVIVVAGGIAFAIYQTGFPVFGAVTAPAGIIAGYGVLGLSLYVILSLQINTLLAARYRTNG